MKILRKRITPYAFRINTNGVFYINVGNCIQRYSINTKWDYQYVYYLTPIVNILKRIYKNEN
jgi:hypothetical protein